MKIYLFEEQSGLIRAEYKERLQEVIAEAGIPVEISFEDAPDSVRQPIADFQNDDRLDDIAYSYIGSEVWNYAFLVATEEGSALEKAGLNKLGHAAWGFSEGNCAADYSPTLARAANQLHESLHFLGVDDCYQEENTSHPKDSCNLENCVMRFGKVSLEVCEDVKRQLRNWAVNSGYVNS
jgi:hypothetical protein